MMLCRYLLIFTFSISPVVALQMMRKPSGPTFEQLLKTVERNQILTKVAKSGVLREIERYGGRLALLPPLLRRADGLDVLGVTEASAAGLLPLAEKVVKTAPTALSVLSKMLLLSATVPVGVAVSSVVLSVVLVDAIPDTTFQQIALQTTILGLFGVIIPILCSVPVALKLASKDR